MSNPSQRATLLIDGDCQFCLRAVKVGQRLGVDCTAVSLQSVDLEEWGIDATKVQSEVALRLNDGSTLYGHEAVAGALRAGGPSLRLLGHVLTWKPLSRLSRRIYHFVSLRRFG